MPPVINSTECLGLSPRVSISSMEAHFEVRLQHEIKVVVEQKTTFREQMGRIGNMMRKNGVYSLPRTGWTKIRPLHF